MAYAKFFPKRRTKDTTAWYKIRVACHDNTSYMTVVALETSLPNAWVIGPDFFPDAMIEHKICIAQLKIDFNRYVH